MPSKKQQKRQLKRRRRIVRDAATTTKINEPRRVSEKHNSNRPKTREATTAARNKKQSDPRNNAGVVKSLAGSVWSYASTWVRKSGSPTLLSIDSSFPAARSTATAAMTITLVLLVSIVVSNQDYLRQAITIDRSSTCIFAIVCVALVVSVVLPFLLWWIVCNAARIGNAIARKGRNEKKIGNELPIEPESIDDEFSMIRPLGLNLKRPPRITTTIGATEHETKYGFDRDLAPSSPPATPQLAASENVRTRLAEWLPFGLRYTSDLNLVFSTSVDGRSLQTLYHQLEAASSSHTILLLEAFVPIPSMKESASSQQCSKLKSKSIVGMYASQRWRSSPKIYGDGRCFLFRVDCRGGDNRENEAHKAPRSECWNWTPLAVPPSHTSTKHNSHTDHKNSMALWETFQRSNNNSLSLGIGASGVGAGLQLNHDLTTGESHRAAGFGNEPLVGDGRHGADSYAVFDVGLVEVYQLVREIDGLPIR